MKKMSNQLGKVNLFKNKEGFKNSYKKIILIIIVLLISISMIPWVISNYNLTGKHDNKWIKVNSKYVDSNIIMGEYNSFLQNNYKRVQQNPYMLISVLSNLVSRYVSTLVFANEAENLNLKLSNETLINVISKIPAFQDAKGNFDKDKLIQQLKTMFGTEEVFLDNVKNEILKEQILGSFMLINDSSKFVSYLEYLFLKQKRTVEYIEIDKNSLKNPLPVATDKDLAQLIKDNEQRFKLPENYTGEVLEFKINKINNSIKISNENIKKFYEENKDIYKDEERRSIKQINFDNEKDAENTYKSFKDKDFSELEKNHKVIYLNNILPNEIDANISKEVFKTKKNILSKPIHSELGWHLIIVSDIIEPKVKPLSEVYTVVKDELFSQALQKQTEATKQKIISLSAKGTSLKDIAIKIGASYRAFNKVNKIALINFLNNEDLKANFLKLKSNNLTDISEDEEGNISIAKLIKIEKERISTVEEVKPMLLTMWKKQKQDEAIQEILSKIILNLSNGKKIANLGYKIKEGTADYTNPKTMFTPEALERIFLSDKNTPIEIQLSNHNKAVGIVTKIKKPTDQLYNKNGSYNKDTLGFVARINNSYTQNRFENYATKVQKKYKISVNQAAIMSLLSPNKEEITD